MGGVEAEAVVGAGGAGAVASCASSFSWAPTQVYTHVNVHMST